MQIAKYLSNRKKENYAKKDDSNIPSAFFRQGTNTTEGASQNVTVTVHYFD
jgi:hypothetical protein